MKKIYFIMLCVFTSLLFASCDCEKNIHENNLPDEIKTYITAHFPSKKIIHARRERDGFVRLYEIRLSDDINLEFSHKRVIKEIKSSLKLPEGAISDKIVKYVNTNYPDNYIIEWERKEKTQKIKLNNGLELKFNKADDFLRIDD